MCKPPAPSQHFRVKPCTLILVLIAAAALSPVTATPLSVAPAEPLWFTGGRPTPQAVALLAELRMAEERGLRASDYAMDFEPSSSLSAQEVARLDARLSLVAERFIKDLHSGRITPKDAGYALDIQRPRFDARAALTALATGPSVGKALDDLEPQFLHYRLLKAVLGRYRSLASHPELNVLPDPGKRAIKPGAVYSGTASLRRLLTALGDLPQAPESGALVLDSVTSRALQTFQARHGLAPDGALGRETYRALTTPFSQRVRQIELSLERWRWLPPRLDSPAIIVNIPEFRLFALYTPADLEGQMLRMDVIVGKLFPYTQTPVFAADMRYVVLHPYWDVPASIVRRELMPLIRRDPGYLARNDYEIVRGQTDAAQIQPVNQQTLDALAAGALRLRQRPGPRNPLGFVKFMLPNPFDVYLHGTSAPRLFAGAERAFSHGCIRVADPMALLNYVLRDNPASDRARVQTLLADTVPGRIKLTRPIRVFIVYTTALAAEDGRALFFKDIYGHDARLQRLLDTYNSQ